MKQAPVNPTAEGRSKATFPAMATAYCLGVFNDNYFKQAAMLMAVAAGLNHLQGWAAVLFALPFILFSAHGGWCADRFPKKRVVVISKGGELAAMAIGAIGLLTGSWPCILGMVFLMGVQSTFFSPSLNGVIPEIYSKKDVPRINAVLKLATTLAILAGIAMAGISLDQQWHETNSVPFGVVVVAVVAVLVSAIGLLASFSIRGGSGSGSSKPFPWFGPWNSLKDLVDICRDKDLLLAVLADTWFYFIASITILIVNALGLQQFGFSQTGTSLLSVCLMLGVCGGSFLAAKIVRIEQWSSYLVLSALGICIGLFLAGATSYVPGSYQYAWLACALLTAGIAGGLFLIPVTSTLQVRPADTEKGRVLAAAGFSSFSAILLSGLLFNLVEPHLLPTSFMTGLGFVSLVVAIFFYLLRSLQNSLLPTVIGRLLRALLSLRYSVAVDGLDNIEKEGKRGILFLPNHPALIDPVIVMSTIMAKFSPRPLSAVDQVDKPFVRTLMKPIRPITLPDLGKNGKSGRDQVHAAINEVVASIRQGENILFYPAGRLNRGPREDLAGNSGVEFILKNVPDVQVVLVRTSGLWGSSFSRASGKAPSLVKHLKTYLKALLCNGLFFSPKRKVNIEFTTDSTLATFTERSQINRYLESHYNELTVRNCRVPYFWWQGREAEIVPEVVGVSEKTAIGEIPESVQQEVTEKIEEVAGAKVQGSERLAQDLGLDSLTIMEIGSWLESEFAIAIEDLAALDTVNDCILAAGGQLQNSSNGEVAAPAKEWFASLGDRLIFEPGETITAAFLKQAAKTPNRIVLADRMTGTKTYRDILTGIFALQPYIKNLKGERVGIMLPASASSAIVYMATLFSGKTPVMFNWTVGVGNMAHGIRQTGVSCIISATPLCSKIEEQQSVSLAELEVDWLHLDTLSKKITKAAKLKAWLKTTFCRNRLAKASVAETAAILFTSGSESAPKAVPLSHANILANLKDFNRMLELADDSRLLGMLPPFHSLGLVGTIIMPFCMGLRTVYHPNPTEPVILADIIYSYKVSLLISTPTFLNGILQAGSKEKLASIRLAFTGAEKCPEQVLNKLKAVNEVAELCEGYGITECSPLVSINAPGASRAGTIGRIMPSIEYAIVKDCCTEHVARGEQGLLLVRGASIFAGYLGCEAGIGFTEFNDKLWYQTGDYVREDEDNHLIFCGRKKRFVKIGGEMISLPAIESALLSGLEAQGEGGPILAVAATTDESRPQIVLFTTEQLDRQEANKHLKQAGLSALHNIRKVAKVEDIPVLGTGKTDYKLLQERLAA